MISLVEGKIKKGLKKKLESFGITKYHLNIFSTNLLALVLGIIFIGSYHSKGVSITSVFTAIFAILLLFVLIGIFISKTKISKRIREILPNKKIIALNLAVALLLGIIFFKSIGLGGFIFTLLFAFLLVETEHIFHLELGYGGLKR